jgi:hypothetical protein
VTHTKYSYDRKLVNGKGLQKILFRLQKRIFKAVKGKDKAKVRMWSIKKVA